jgi:hypothetical protein
MVEGGPPKFFELGVVVESKICSYDFKVLILELRMYMV